MNEEIEDALHMILHCSLKDTEYETQVEQYKIVRKYITNLQQENKQLKDNWNKLKEYINIKLYNTEYLQRLCGCKIDDETHMILDIIKEEMRKLEQGSGSNE